MLHWNHLVKEMMILDLGWTHFPLNHGGMILLMYTSDFDFVEASFYAELYNVFAAACSVAGGNA